MMNSLRGRGGRGGMGCLGTVGLALLALVVVFFLWRGNRSESQTADPQSQAQGGVFGGNSGGILGGGAAGSLPAGFTPGRLVLSNAVDSNGCAVGSQTEFDSSELIYVTLDRSRIPAGTELFARLSDEQGPLEDADPIVADQEMTTCVWFAFEPEARGAQLAPGLYLAEIYANGQLVEQAQLQIGAFGAGMQQVGVTGGVSEENLGRVVAAVDLDQYGCAMQAVQEFRSDERIYIAGGPSYLAAGTSAFARLVANGQVLEETDPIVAENETRSCIFFQFEPPNGGFPAGAYTGELIVNGQQAGAASFQVGR